jgi:branched-chain amino acid aminotransferase
MAHPAYVWIDGKLTPWDEATVHITSVGWSTMSGVFEGVKAYWNPDQAQLYGLQFREHFERFHRSMKMMRMQTPFSAQDLVQATTALLRANDCREDTYIRPIAYFPDVTWFQAMRDERTSIYISTAPFTSHLGAGRVSKACVSSWTRLGDNQMSPRIKAISNYQNSRMALLEALHDGYDSPILLNAQGKVTEGPASCLFFVRDGVVITPSLTSGILESVTRTTMLRLCRDVLDIPAVERDVDRTELYIADEIFFCGTGAELSPVGEVDHYVVGDGALGPLTKRIEAAFHDLVRGREQRFPSYRTPVYDAVAATR